MRVHFFSVLLHALVTFGFLACAGAKGDAGPVTAAAMCGSSPRVLVDYVAELPHGAGDGGVSVSYSAPLIAVNSTHLYFILQWSSGGTGLVIQGTLMRVAVRGGKAERLASLPSGSIQFRGGLALTGSDAVFIQGPSRGVGNAAIAKVPLSGGHTTLLAETVGDANAVVVDETNAYFVDTEGAKSVPLAGGTVRTLVSGEIPLSLVSLGNTLYLASSNKVTSVAKDGGDSGVVANTGGGPVIACGDDICWLGGGGLMATLMRLSLGGQPGELASGLVEPHDIVFDGTNFFIATGRGAVERVPASGGVADSVFGEEGIASLALDDTCLYWSSATTISSVSTSAADAVDAGE